MRALHQEEFKNIFGGTKVKAEWERFKGRVQREFDRNVKKSIERMGGDTSGLCMRKAHEEDDKKLEEAKQETGFNFF